MTPTEFGGEAGPSKCGSFACVGLGQSAALSSCGWSVSFFLESKSRQLRVGETQVNGPFALGVINEAWRV